MTRQTFVRRSRIAVSADEVYQWHARVGALELSIRRGPTRSSSRRVGRAGGNR